MTISHHTPDEQDALNRLLETFPGSVVGDAIPGRGPVRWSREERPAYDALVTARVLMNGNGLAHELRVIGEIDGKSVIESARCDTPEWLAHLAERCDGKANLYITVNPCKFGANHVLSRGRATSDGTIARIRWLPIDWDDEEHPTALREHLASLGFPEPFVGFSGHGWWLLYRVNQENTKEATELRRRVLAALKNDFSAVDTTAYNASRVMRLFGTLNVKDPSAQIRSRVESVPDEIRIVPDELLEVVAGGQPEIPEPSPEQGTPAQLDKILEKLAERDIRVAPGYPKRAMKPGDIYGLTGCPFYPEKDHHRAAALYAWDDGRVHFECLGETCQNENHRIGDLLELLGLREVARKVGGRILSWATEITPKPIETIWETRILLYDLNAVVGREKAGKGLLLKRLTADLTTGVLTGKSERVLYMSPEESVDAQRIYLEAAGADLSRVLLVPAGSYALPDDTDDLVRDMTEREIRLAVIDAVNKNMAPRLDPDSKRDVALVLGTLEQMAAEHRITVIASLHLARGKDGMAAADAWAHSMEWRRAMRSAVLIGKTEDDGPDERTVVHDFNNYRKTSSALKCRIEQAETSGGSAAHLVIVREDAFVDPDDLFWRPQRTAGATKRQEVRQSMDEIAEKIRRGELVHALDSTQFEGLRDEFDAKTIQRARQDLGIKVETRSDGQGGIRNVWHFPAGAARCEWCSMREPEAN